MTELIGVGLYTPSEASQLLSIPGSKIRRWLLGHKANDRHYAPLWTPQVDLDDNRVYLNFRDLMEVRMVNAFIASGLSAQRVRSAIVLARSLLNRDYPLSTDRFRTDGRDIFLRVIDTDERGEERERLLNLFRKQYVFKQIVDPILKTIDFDGVGAPKVWWPAGRPAKVVVDPTRSFGQPIDYETRVPTAVLAAAAKLDGVKGAATAYAVPLSSVRRAIDFHGSIATRLAA